MQIQADSPHKGMERAFVTSTSVNTVSCFELHTVVGAGGSFQYVSPPGWATLFIGSTVDHQDWTRPRTSQTVFPETEYTLCYRSVLLHVSH